MKELECEYCGGVIQSKKVTVEHWHGDKLVIIKNVAVGICRECGERYYEAATLEQLDAMAQKSESAQERISVPVMALNP